LKKKEINVMANIKIIEGLKAQLLCIIGEFFKLLTKGSNITQNSILECLSSAIIILYVLAERLGYTFKEIDNTIKEKLQVGIKAEDEIEKEGKSLSQLKNYITNRID
jgi:hypothetical protein